MTAIRRFRTSARVRTCQEMEPVGGGCRPEPTPERSLHRLGRAKANESRDLFDRRRRCLEQPSRCFHPNHLDVFAGGDTELRAEHAAEMTVRQMHAPGE